VNLFEFVLGIGRGFAMEGKAHGHENSAKASWIRYNGSVEFEDYFGEALLCARG
jgi:hypothetical protein